MDLSVNVWKKEEEYVASCPELEISCYGVDEKQARKRLGKVISFYAETASDLGYNIDLNGLSTENIDGTSLRNLVIKKRSPVFS